MNKIKKIISLLSIIPGQVAISSSVQLTTNQNVNSTILGLSPTFQIDSGDYLKNKISPQNLNIDNYYIKFGDNECGSFFKEEEKHSLVLNRNNYTLIPFIQNEQDFSRYFQSAPKFFDNYVYLSDVYHSDLLTTNQELLFAIKDKDSLAHFNFLNFQDISLWTKSNVSYTSVGKLCDYVDNPIIEWAIPGQYFNSPSQTNFSWDIPLIQNGEYADFFKFHVELSTNLPIFNHTLIKYLPKTKTTPAHYELNFDKKIELNYEIYLDYKPVFGYENKEVTNLSTTKSWWNRKLISTFTDNFNISTVYDNTNEINNDTLGVANISTIYLKQNSENLIKNNFQAEFSIDNIEARDFLNNVISKEELNSYINANSQKPAVTLKYIGYKMVDPTLAIKQDLRSEWKNISDLEFVTSFIKQNNNHKTDFQETKENKSKKWNFTCDWDSQREFYVRNPILGFVGYRFENKTNVEIFEFQYVYRDIQQHISNINIVYNV